MLSGAEYILIGLAAIGAGLVNALAGGGTLITFPALIAVGIPLILSLMISPSSVTISTLPTTLQQEVHPRRHTA